MSGTKGKPPRLAPLPPPRPKGTRGYRTGSGRSTFAEAASRRLANARMVERNKRRAGLVVLIERLYTEASELVMPQTAAALKIAREKVHIEVEGRAFPFTLILAGTFAEAADYAREHALEKRRWAYAEMHNVDSYRSDVDAVVIGSFMSRNDALQIRDRVASRMKVRTA